MMRVAPASRAPCKTLRPTPPAPITTTLAPASTWATLTTAPIPVETPQAIRQAGSRGTLNGMGMQLLAGSVVSWAKEETPWNW